MWKVDNWKYTIWREEIASNRHGLKIRQVSTPPRINLVIGLGNTWLMRRSLTFTWSAILRERHPIWAVAFSIPIRVVSAEAVTEAVLEFAVRNNWNGNKPKTHYEVMKCDHGLWSVIMGYEVWSWVMKCDHELRCSNILLWVLETRIRMWRLVLPFMP